MAPSPPWSNLPVDILIDIFNPLEIGDRIRVSAVCTSFEMAISLCLMPRPLPPWIKLDPPSNGSNNENDESFGHYYNICDKKVQKIPQKMLFYSWQIIGSSHGWLVEADEMSNLHLINPITNAHIPLPPITTMEGVTPIFDDEGNMVQYRIDEFGDVEIQDLHNQFSNVVLLKDPNDGDYIVMLIHTRKEQGFEFNTVAKTLITKAGERNWSLLDNINCYHDFSFKEGVFYGVTELGGVHAFDFREKLTGKIIVDEPCMDDKEYFDSDKDVNSELLESILTPKYILMAPWGDVLLILRKLDSCDETVEINVHKINLSSGMVVELESIGEYSLFVGVDSGCFYAKNSSNVRSNSIYFLENNSVGVYDLAKRSLQYESFFDLFGRKVLSVWMSQKQN